MGFCPGGDIDDSMEHCEGDDGVACETVEDVEALMGVCRQEGERCVFESEEGYEC